MTGRLLRTKCADTNNRGPHGTYVLHDDGDLPAGAFGCWRSGLSQTWCSKDTQAMTGAERSAHPQRMQAIAKLCRALMA